MKSEYRWIAVIILALFMSGMIWFTITNWDELSQRQVEVTYADKCVETYINEELQGEECTYGRLLEEERKKRQGAPRWPQIDTSKLNISGD